MAEIKFIEISLIIKEISKIRYFIIKYIYIFFLLFKKLNISELVLIKITINIYLINDFRVNILIKINTINSKGINIIIIKRYIYITSYNIYIPIKIKL